MVGNNGRAAPTRPKQGIFANHFPDKKPKRVIVDELNVEFRFEGVNDELRAKFQSAFPFPPGVKWDGDFIHGTNEVIGSFRNATEWSAMWRGFRKAYELMGAPK